jgi:antitoxin component of MazEF toxin-antitoxin module
MANRAIEKVSEVIRWGSSFGVRIPEEVVEQLRLKEGQAVTVRVSGQTIIIRRAKRRIEWTEQDLLKGVRRHICGPDLIPDRAGGELL